MGEALFWGLVAGSSLYSVVTFIGVAYSLLFLVVQFGTTTFTPRLNLFRDAPIVWHSFGFFAGIFVFSFTAAFSTGADEDEITGLVPVTLALEMRVLKLRGAAL